jgi:DNA modification methylase
LSIPTNELHNEDCIAGLKKLADSIVDLAFADPPFNIGYEYDEYHDVLESEKYLDWSRQWLGEVVRVLKPSGTFWLAIGDEYAAELKVALTRELKMACRSWVVWYYTFGVNCKANFSRSHTHLFYMVKDPESFTFNAESQALRVPSARQLVYGDKRANPKGRLPDNTWILRPQDLPEAFTPIEDTWYFSRVCGTFKERTGWHTCQMPERLLGRIIEACSNPGEVVLDPFAGSGTTLAAAKKLGRRYLGYELSKQYAGQTKKRLGEIKVGDPLEGVADPVVSVPSTDKGRRLDAVGAPRKAPHKRKSKSAVLFDVD